MICVNLSSQTLFATRRITIGKALFVGINSRIARIREIHGVLWRPLAHVLAAGDPLLDDIDCQSFTGILNIVHIRVCFVAFIKGRITIAMP